MATASITNLYGISPAGPSSALPGSGAVNPVDDDLLNTAVFIPSTAVGSVQKFVGNVGSVAFTDGARVILLDGTAFVFGQTVAQVRTALIS